MAEIIDLGGVTVRAVLAGRLRLDGGAMFGVLPKSLWAKLLEPDDRNRIPLAMWCLLIDAGGERTLIETGFGGKVDDKMRDIFDLAESPGLVGGLEAAGIQAGEIDRVILTHLHQDHAGGTTVRAGDGYAPTFPNARYIVQDGEWQDAWSADGQTRNGYQKLSILKPLDKARVVDRIDGETSFGPVRVVVTPGHTRNHQSVLVEGSEGFLFFTGDLVPTASHLRPIHVMAFDLFPRETFLNKTMWMDRAVDEAWWVSFPHDPEAPWGKVQRDFRDGFELVLS